MSAYATRVGDHLAESRRAGLSFEQARKVAEAELTPDPEFPADAWNYFEQGYYRRRVGHKGGVFMSLIAEPRDTSDHEYVAPPYRGVKACGSGDGCDAPRAPKVRLSRKVALGPDVTMEVWSVSPGWLCLKHRDEIMAAFKRAEYRGPQDDVMEASEAYRKRVAA